MRARQRRGFINMEARDARTATFSVLKVSEGGIGYRDAVISLRLVGILATWAPSAVIGCVGVKVHGTPKQIARAEQVLFGMTRGVR